MKYFVIRRTYDQGALNGCFRQFDSLKEAKDLMKKLKKNKSKTEYVIISKIIKGNVVK